VRVLFVAGIVRGMARQDVGIFPILLDFARATGGFC